MTMSLSACLSVAQIDSCSRQRAPL